MLFTRVHRLMLLQFNKKRGFFTPHTNNATSVYSKVIDELYRFFAQPNAELVRSVGGTGITYPSGTHRPHLSDALAS